MNGILRTMHVASWELSATLEELAALEVPTIEEQDNVVFITYIDNKYPPYPFITEPPPDDGDTEIVVPIVYPVTPPDGDTVTVNVDGDEETQKEKAA